MHRKFALAAVAAASALVLAACGGSGGGSSSSSGGGGGGGQGDCPGADAFCIGLVTDTGKVDDKSFNQSAWEGALEAAAATGGYAKYIETVDPKDYENNINQFVTANYDVIVTVGFLMGEASVAAAKANPNVQFIGVDQFQAETIPNLTGLVFPEDKAGYAAGYLAGLMTKTNKIGAVLGTDTVPPVKLFGEGYKAGVLAANPNAEVTLVYHAPDNAFNDPEWGAAEAKKQLAQGADVIFGAGGNTGNGALIEIAKAPGAGETIFCIGVDTDQYFTVPQAQKCLLTSAEKKLTLGTKTLIEMVKDGKAPGGNYVGLTGLAPYHDTESVVPEDVKAKVAEIIAGLDDGSIQTGVTL
ncbi:MAG: BMP family ABC transporter substrate-binding protein [Actinomycetales bacterium mxb001]|nr:MAG: BMP family ABC transporter substrate-binding protein [Actinomycetales bacterium mxb001]